MKVAKFGGSSVATADQFQKVKAIIDQDPQRQLVVVSAAGKYGPATQKLTDILYLIADGIEAGRNVTQMFAQVEARLEAINHALQLHVPLIKLMNTIRHRLATHYSRDYLVSRGEFLTARLMAAYLATPSWMPPTCSFLIKTAPLMRPKPRQPIASFLSITAWSSPDFTDRIKPGMFNSCPVADRISPAHG